VLDGNKLVFVLNNKKVYKMGDYQMEKMDGAPYRIDVHQHIIPEFYTSALKKIGVEAAHGEGFPKWTQSLSIETMDEAGIAASIVSLSSPGVYFGDSTFSSKLARQCNEYFSQLVSVHPDRFGFFATLPMPATDLAVEEAVYALDVLKADGIVLLASSGDKFLGDPDFDELMFELNKRKTVVFIHPNVHPSSYDLKLDIPGFYIEFLFDTTRAVTNLILSGVIERYPDIRWILPHAGGTVPYIAWRLSLANMDPKLLEKAPRGVLAYLKTFYYDTALSTSSYAMFSLKELVGSSQILFGSDFPYAPAPLVAKEVTDFQKLEMFNNRERRLIERNNALHLFPRFKMKDELIPKSFTPSIQKYEKFSLATRIALSIIRKLMDRT
jgi:predicted TIM-barrel fold metal-dependent hydrolase